MAEQIPTIRKPPQRIIFFDGVCNLCNWSVQTVIRNDKKNKFQFASLQSTFTANFFKQHNFHNTSDSIIYFNGDSFYEKSNAALRISKHLRFPYPVLIAFWIFPAFIRNAFYNWVARNRYKWFGKRESCMIPTSDLKSRFLD